MEKETKIYLCTVCMIANVNINQFNVDKQIPVQAVEMPGSMNDNLDVQVSPLCTTGTFEACANNYINGVGPGYMISVKIDFKCHQKCNSHFPWVGCSIGNTADAFFWCRFFYFYFVM